MKPKDDEPDYDRLDLAALLDVERWIDRNAYPARYARLKSAIANRRSAGPPLPRSDSKKAIAGPAKPLAIRPIVVQAFVETGRHWRALFRALLVPAFLIAALPLAFDSNEETSGWSTLLWALSLLISAIYAVSCHRIMLLGEAALPNRYGIYWTQRETRFIGWSIVIAILAAFSFIPLGVVVGFDAFNALGESFNWLTWLVIYAPAAYVTSRVSMVLPATAIDLRPSIEQSWNRTKDNGWRLTVALATPGLLSSIPVYALGRAISVPEGALVSFISALCLCLIGVVEITVLSVSFRFLSGTQSPRRDALASKSRGT